MSRPITVSAIQITPVDGEKEANVEKMLRLLDVAGNRGSGLPELWTGLGYSTPEGHRAIAEEISGFTSEVPSMAEEFDPFDLSRLAGHRPVGELVYTAIRLAILRNIFSPGQRLVTEELASRMKVSRTPVREAIRKLEIDGLVKGEPWRGVVVAELPPLEEMEEFYSLRGALEGLVGFFAARRRQQSKLDGLRSVIEAMEDASASGDLDRFIDLQVDFWDRYIGLASSKRIFQVASAIRNSLERAKPISLSRPGRMPETITELRAVFEAIVAGDSPGAESLAREHCRLAYEAFRTVMENRIKSAAGEGNR